MMGLRFTHPFTRAITVTYINDGEETEVEIRIDAFIFDTWSSTVRDPEKSGLHGNG